MTNVFGWLFLVLVLVGLGGVAGASLHKWLTGHRERALRRDEFKIQAEWNALHTAQRLQAAFLETRRLMQEEAIRQRPRPSPR